LQIKDSNRSMKYIGNEVDFAIVLNTMTAVHEQFGFTYYCDISNKFDHDKLIIQFGSYYMSMKV